MDYALNVLFYAIEKRKAIFIVEIKTKETSEIVHFLLEDYNLAPLGLLSNYFETYHNFEFPQNLNPKLRRQWTVAHAIDKFTYEFFNKI